MPHSETDVLKGGCECRTSVSEGGNLGQVNLVAQE